MPTQNYRTLRFRICVCVFIKFKRKCKRVNEQAQILLNYYSKVKLNLGITTAAPQTNRSMPGLLS